MDVVYSYTAQNDLRLIFQYINTNLKAPQAARRTFETIAGSIRGLSEMPERHPLCSDDPWHALGMRKMMVLNFIVFYLVDEKVKRIAIARIVYGGRNINDVMKEEINYVK